MRDILNLNSKINEMKKFWRFSDLEKNYISKTLDNGLNGKTNIQLEKLFCKKFSTKYAISVNSCTSALHISMLSLGIGRDDEVIVPPLTFIATSFAPLYVGAKPIFADIEKDTFNIDPISIEKKITKKTKAIIAVALYGLPANLKKIRQIAKKNNLFLIEDNAEAIYGLSNGKIAGYYSDICVYSFQRSKHLTSGDGGMLTTNNKKLATLIRKYSDLGYRKLTAKPITNENFKDKIQHPTYKRHELVGLNYRMPEVCAAIMLSQVEKSKMFLTKRVQCANSFKKIINKCEWLKLQNTPKKFRHTYWTLAFVIDKSKTKITWNDFRNEFIKNGGHKYYGAWQLSYMEPVFFNKKINGIHYKKGLCPVAEDIQPQIIQLKTNFENLSLINSQTKALTKTISALNKRFSC